MTWAMGRRTVARVVVLCVGVGCAPKLPPTPTVGVRAQLPATFSPAGAPAGEVADADAQAAGAPGWREWLTEPELRALVEEALSAGFEARLAEVARARAAAGLRAAGARRLPSVSGAAGGGVTRFPVGTAEGAGYRGQPIAGRAPPPLYPEVGVGLEARWEVSTWGALRHARRGAAARALAADAEAQLVTAVVASELAAAWYQLAAQDALVSSLEAAADRRAAALRVVEAQAQAARADSSAVAQVAATLADAQAALTAARQGRREQELSINAVLGRMPQPVPRAAGALSRPPTPPRPGLPAAVLARRPDVRAAELRLEAAGFDLQAARAAFFPTIELRAGLGLAAMQATRLRVPEAVAWGLGGALVGPLLNRGALQLGFAEARADQIEALVHYERTLVEGVIEVIGQVEGLAQAELLVAHRAAQRAAAEEGVRASGALFAAGKRTAVDVIIAEEAMLEADRAQVAAELERCLRAIALARALGGGWEGAPPPQSSAPSRSGRSSSRR
jgi:multidrug efflux system outer membrane protein